MQDDHIILGVHITDRIKHVGGVQQALTEYGCYIKTRLGLHEAGKDFCSPNGLMLLELVGDVKKCNELEAKLSAIEGVSVQKMVFEH
ncbi:MAG TPA: hypothetical protein DDW84_07935 [Phycisphaerales bacterium]|nr:MAG: hypothetical protein A2Y13_10220 [Planctomycetes bacterium GWC2_45_44]HBG78752.1 hypothetical protein [Phycisphaerales bacterium]HBR20063.1 hypothetical protein [Phycisphaerales bacterium]